MIKRKKDHTLLLLLLHLILRGLKRIKLKDQGQKKLIKILNKDKNPNKTLRLQKKEKYIKEK